MKKILFILGVISLLAVGCNVAADNDKFMAEQVSSINGFNNIYRFVDTDNNIVCYVHIGNGISCVKK